MEKVEIEVDDDCQRALGKEDTRWSSQMMMLPIAEDMVISQTMLSLRLCWLYQSSTIISANIKLLQRGIGGPRNI